MMFLNSMYASRNGVPFLDLVVSLVSGIVSFTIEIWGYRN